MNTLRDVFYRRNAFSKLSLEYLQSEKFTHGNDRICPFTWPFTELLALQIVAAVDLKSTCEEQYSTTINTFLIFDKVPQFAAMILNYADG